MGQLETRARILATVAAAAARVDDSPLAQLQRVEVQAGVITAPLRQQQVQAFRVHTLSRHLAVSGATPCVFAARCWAITDAAASRTDDGSLWAC